MSDAKKIVFDTHDADKDGLITKEELEAIFKEYNAQIPEDLDAKFTEADADSDGKITWEEYQKFQPQPAEQAADATDAATTDCSERTPDESAE